MGRSRGGLTTKIHALVDVDGLPIAYAGRAGGDALRLQELGLSPPHWTDAYSGWLVRTPDGYVRGPRLPDFKAQHPRNDEEIRADKEKWEPKRMLALKLERRSSAPDRPTRALL